MPYTRVKICGITRPQDAQLAAELGADAIGLNFVNGPRQITLDQGKRIIEGLAPMPLPPNVIALCGLRSPEMPAALTAGEIARKISATCFQIYGRSQANLLNDDESPPFWLVCPIENRESIRKLVIDLHVEPLHATALVLDTASSQLGGTGQTFNWNWIAEARAAGELENLPPIILAGGLTPDNVADAIRIVRPYAVDVSSGVEVPNHPGIKDPLKLRDFIQAAKGV